MLRQKVPQLSQSEVLLTTLRESGQRKTATQSPLEGHSACPFIRSLFFAIEQFYK